MGLRTVLPTETVDIFRGCDVVRCEKCKGDRFITGMGYMREKCDNCKGKGFVEKEVLKVKDKKKE